VNSEVYQFYKHYENNVIADMLSAITYDK